MSRFLLSSVLKVMISVLTARKLSKNKRGWNQIQGSPLALKLKLSQKRELYPCMSTFWASNLTFTPWLLLVTIELCILYMHLGGWKWISWPLKVTFLERKYFKNYFVLSIVQYFDLWFSPRDGKLCPKKLWKTRKGQKELRSNSRPLVESSFSCFSKTLDYIMNYKITHLGTEEREKRVDKMGR